MADSCPSSLTKQHFCFINKKQNCSLKQKLISQFFIVFDNFFKVALVYVSLLWWNINAILKISIENFMEYPKHNKIQFSYRNPSAFILLKGFWKVARMKKKQWLIWISLCSQQSSWVGRKLTLYVWNWLLRHQVAFTKNLKLLI